MRSERFYLADILAVHAYFSVDWRVVYVTIQDDLPALRRETARLLG
jgi:uncharacterized protein with HEPN domain